MEYAQYDPAFTPLSLPSDIPYRQYLQSRDSWQFGNTYLDPPDDMSWMVQEDWMLAEQDNGPVQQLTTTQKKRIDGVRQADAALSSWNVEKLSYKRSVSRLSLSTKGSTADLREFLHSRGKTKLDGMHLAAAKSDINTIMKIIRREGPTAPINQLDENECTPLMYAVLADSISSIEMLLHCSAKREQTDSKGRTAVHYAAFFGKAKSLKFLIEAAAHWMPRDMFGRTPLHWSAANKDVKCLQVLIKHSSIVMGNINPRDNEGMTPLHCAAQYCRPKHVYVLYEADCEFSATDVEDKTALHWTVNNPDPSCIEALVTCFPSLLNVRDVYGQTVLHLTAKVGSIHLLEALLACEGIEIDAKDSNEQTALHIASMEGKSGALQLLLLHGALDSCIDISGLTALHYAVLSNSSECVQHLAIRSHITHVPSADDKSHTPLMIAASNGLSDVIKMLVTNDEVRQSLDQTDPKGQCALHLACESGAAECVLVLVDQGANPNIYDKFKRTPLIVSCENGQANCVGPLVEGGAELPLPNAEGQTCLHVAVQNGHTSVVKQLILFGATVDNLNEAGNTPLELAISLNSEVMVETLLDKGANPNNLNVDGMTPLHLAAKLGHANLLKLFLEREGYVNNMDGTLNRYTPLDYAEQYNQSDCVNLLLQCGGITINDIKNIASICIQSAYRRHRARKQLKILTLQTHAVILIQKMVRGFLTRKWYQRTIRESKAATRIQALVRGFIQRQHFKKLLEIQRLEDNQRGVILAFGNFIQDLKNRSIIKPISLDLNVRQETHAVDSKKQKEDEQRRVERMLKMRSLYLEQQKNWLQFRMAEKQRRIDKAHQEKMDHMNGILQSSQARRQYFTEQFQYTMSVRMRNQAASVIQRAFRHFKKKKIFWKGIEEAKMTRKRVSEFFAASVIQNAWRRYREWKRFESAYMCPIFTNPVIQLASKATSNEQTDAGRIKSYERSTITSGMGRRKLHQTSSGGFKIFKPLPKLQMYTKPPVAPEHQIVLTVRDSCSKRVQNMKANWPWFERLLKTPNGSANSNGRGDVKSTLVRNGSKTNKMPPIKENINAVCTSTSCHMESGTAGRNTLKLPEVN